jgi:hypothetical protein
MCGLQGMANTKNGNLPHLAQALEAETNRHHETGSDFGNRHYLYTKCYSILTIIAGVRGLTPQANMGSQSQKSDY